MRKLNQLIAAALVTISLNSFAGNCPELSGTYTIGKSATANFNSVTEAVEAAECGGVNGPVTFQIENGNYYERVVMSSVPGTSAINNITFESKSGYNTDVVISYSSLNATLVMNGTSYVSFENITINHRAAVYGNVMHVDGKATAMHFSSVIFNGIDAPRTGANSATVYFTSNAPKTDISFNDCEINNGSMGIVKGGHDAETADTKTVISGTVFSNQFETALALSNETAPAINNNIINSTSNFSNYMGISLSNVSGEEVINNNVITMALGSTGIEMFNCKAEADHYGQIIGNTVSVGGNDEANGISMTGNTDNQVLNLNCVKLNNGAESINQAYYRNKGTGNNIDIMNNIFCDLSTGGYTMIGGTDKGAIKQTTRQTNTGLTALANGLMTEKVTAVR